MSGLYQNLDVSWTNLTFSLLSGLPSATTQLMSWQVPRNIQPKALKIQNVDHALRNIPPICRLTRYVEPWEVWEGVKVAGRAPSTCWGPDPSIHGAIRERSIWFISARHAPFLRKLGLDYRSWASLAESHTHSHYPVILVGCRWYGEGGSGWSLIARWTALSW